MSWMGKQPWLGHAKMEAFFILLPPLLPLFLLFSFPNYFAEHNLVTDAWWLILVLGIDVSHVYSTTFRFYWEPALIKKYKVLLIVIPLVSLALGCLLHFISPLLFWRILAYMAVFHFIRQQYGFMRLYSRKDNSDQLSRWVDIGSIYAATIYPLIYWHIHRTQDISWFIQGDFFDLSFIESASSAFQLIYWLLILTYLIKEIIISVQNRIFNIPKNVVMIGTYVSWYVGIVTAQGDLTFTLLNVVAHGIPYMALVWLYGHREKKAISIHIPWKEIGIFIGYLLLLAYLEESLWDIMIWKDHPAIFPFLQNLPRPDAWIISILVPLLSLPQITHYVIDGFIWRRPAKAT